MHMYRCALTREIRRYETFFFYFLVKKLFATKVDVTKKRYFCLICPVKAKMWPNVVKSGMAGFKKSTTDNRITMLASEQSLLLRDLLFTSKIPGINIGQGRLRYHQ